MKEILHRSQAESLFELLVYRKKQNPNKIVYKVINNDRSVTDVSYQDLWERVQEARTVLAGQDKDVPYFLLYESPIEFIIGFLALASLGVTGMPMTVPGAYEELERWENIYQDAGRAGVLTEKAQVKEIRERFSQSEILREADVFCNQREGKGECESVTEYRICPESLLQYTSGSTGIPKGVIITHQGILHSMEQTEKRFQVNEDSVFVNWVPFHHMLGSITGMLQSIYSNSQAVLLKPQQFMEEPLFWMELVSKFHATHTGAPNFAYELITKELSRRIQKMGKEEAQKELQKVYSMESLKIFYCAGEPVSVTTLNQFIQNVRLAGWSGTGVFPAYGLTETTQFSSTYSCGQKVSWLCVSREDLEKNVIRVLERGVLGEDTVSEREDAFYMMGAGYTMSEDCTCIVNQTGAKCKPYEIGEVNFAGDSLTSGYWKKETADEESFWTEKETERRFLHTGDIGFLTEDGELFVTGRSKDLIILRGMNYVPQDIERIVQAASPIFNHYATAAFGIEKNGEEVLVILQEMEESISKEQHSKLEQKIKQAVLKAFQIRPEQILLVPEQSIPRTRSGKLRRGEAKKSYLEGIWDVKAEEESRKQKKPVKSAVWTKQKIEYFIKAQISEKTGLSEKKIGMDMPFLELGMNSIMFLDMRSQISEQCGSEISVADLFHYHTVREMTDYLYGVLKEKTIEEEETESDNQSRYSDTEPLAVIGMACHLPGGVENEDDFWTLLEEEQDGVIPVEESRWNEREDVKEGYLKRAGFLKEDIEQFDCRLFRTAPAEAERIDPQQRLFLKTCWEAIENAGYAPDTLKGSRTGVYAGISSTEYQMEAWKDRMFGEKKRDAQENSLDLLGNYPSFLTGRVSYYFGLQGPAVTVDTACSSSLVSIDHACSDLRNQTCDMALAGGVNLMISPDTTKLVAGLHILSEDGIIRSFDDSANGTVRGEGCSVVVLKRLSKAIEDHDMIHAVIVGNRTNQDGPSAGMTAPYGSAQENLLKDTWRHFHIDSNDIDYMEAHGTGTKLGDPIELDAINHCLSKDRKHPLYIGTAKSNIGHLEAASGVAGLMKTVLMLEHKKIPGLLHFKKPNSHFNWERSLITVPKETIAWEKEGERMAGVSSFGLSGTNAHFVLKEFNQQWENLPEQDEYAFKFSSNTEKGLRKQISAFADYVKFYEGSMAVLSYSQNISKADLEERLVILAKTKEELYTRLLLVLDGKRDAKVLVRESEKPVVFLCTGQGSQHEKMLLDLYAENERFAYWMNYCEELYQSLTGNSLLKVIRQEGKILDETRYTQPSLFAVEYSLGKMWMEYGIEPKYLIGHSIGEYAAACLAGVFSLEDAMKLVTARGEYMFQLNTEGKMAALFCSREEALPYLEEGAVSIAAGNSPNQTILSGKAERVEAVCEAARAKGIKTAFLHVSHAFHSPLMEPMVAEFRKVAEAVRYHEPEIEILSNVTGKVVCGEIADSEYWCRHILSEVRFEEGIRSISNPSDYVFLEIGPKPVLTALLKQICGKDVDCLVSAYPKQNTEKQVLESVLSLYLHGCHINWRKLYGNHNYKRVRVPNYRFSEQKLGISQIQVLSGKVVQTKQLEKRNQMLSEEKEQRLILAEESPVIPEDWMAFLKQELSRELKLDTEEIKEDDNLLLFGINSIAVMRLTSKWNKIYALFLSTAEFMKHCTLKDWYNLLEHAAAHTKEKEEIKFESVPEEKGEPFELNPIQYAYWAGRNCEIEWGGAGCYACYALKQKGLDVKHFQDAVIKLIERHDMLRCLIGKDGKQQIQEHIEIPLKIYPYKEDLNMEELEQKVYSEIRLQAIPLDQPMYDIRLVESEKQNWTVYFGIDFMIADALSLRIIWNDLSALYQGKTLEPLGVTYRDYLKYEKQKPQTKPYQAAKEYWMQKVRDFPEAPVLPIRQVSSKEKHTFTRHKFWLSKEQWKQFEKQAARRNLTPSAALLTLYSEVLSAWSGQNRFAIMLTVFSRDPVHPQIEKLVGDFTRLVLLDIQRKQEATGKNARRIQQNMQEDLEKNIYSALDFVKEKKRIDPASSSLYPVVFTSALGMEEGEEDKDSFAAGMECQASSTPQVWIDSQVFWEEEGVTVSWDALDEIFLPEVIDDMFSMYTKLIERAMEEEDFWEQEIVDLRPDAQKEKQNRANQTSQKYIPQLLDKKIWENIERQPDAIAVICEDKAYTYRELGELAEKTAAFLQSKGAEVGETAAVQVQKSFVQIGVILGILKAGLTYIPLTYHQPEERTRKIMEQAQCRFLLTDIRQEISSDVMIMLVEEIQKFKGNLKNVSVSPSQLAYIIFTSGSTGEPKGVCISHREVMNTILAVNKQYQIGNKDCAIALSAISFDLSVYDIFGMLNAGGTIAVPTENQRMDPAGWKHMIKAYHVTVWNSVPALMELYVDSILSSGENFYEKTVRQVILSGDWIPLTLPDKIKEVFPGVKLTSMGGATECSIWSNYFDVDRVKESWNSIPYGYPLPNQRFYVLDEAGRPCPDYVRGKLHIGGLGVADGYLNAPEITDRAFGEKGFAGERVYDTGDYGRYIEDGMIEFLGRMDQQVKINGYRIEMKEIQTAFQKCGVTEEAVILPIGNRLGKKKLAAFLKKSACGQSGDNYKKDLRKYLPEYFVPDQIFILDEIPVTANGKVDRKKLESKAMEAPVRKKRKTDTSNPILLLVREVLNLPDLGAEDNFSEMGVSSVDMIRLANELECSCKRRPSVGEMMAYETIEELLSFYEEEEKDSNETSSVSSQKSIKPVSDMSEKEDTEEELVSENLKRTPEMISAFSSLYEEEGIIPVTEEECQLVQKILIEFEKENITLWSDNGKLRYKAPNGTMTTEKVRKLKEEKHTLLRYFACVDKINEKAGKTVRLTPIQLAYVLGRQPGHELGNVNAQYYVEFETDSINQQKFEEAVNQVVCANEMLRTVIYEEGVQQAMPEVPHYQVAVEEGVTGQSLEEIRKEWTAHRYPMGTWPYFHVQISHMLEGRTRIHVNYDCMIFDGWSASIFLNEIFRAYHGERILKPQISFQAYIQKEDKWKQEHGSDVKDESYWLLKADSLPEAPKLPVKTPFRDVKEPHFKRLQSRLSVEETRVLKRKIKESRNTDSAVICAAYMHVLSKWCGQDRLTLNVTLFNRLPLHPDVPLVLGDFTNIALIPYEGRQHVFAEEVNQVQKEFWGAVEHRTFNGINLLNRLSGEDQQKAVMPVVFTSLLFGDNSKVSLNTLPEQLKQVYAISQTPQVALDHQAFERSGELVLAWDYVEEIMDREVLEEVFASYVEFLKNIQLEQK